MGAIFIIPVHGTDPVQLLYAQHLKMQAPKNIFDYYKKKDARIRSSIEKEKIIKRRGTDRAKLFCYFIQGLFGLLMYDLISDIEG